MYFFHFIIAGNIFFLKKKIFLRQLLLSIFSYNFMKKNHAFLNYKNKTNLKNNKTLEPLSYTRLSRKTFSKNTNMLVILLYFLRSAFFLNF